MQCDHDWSVRFLDTDENVLLEARPAELSLEQSHSKYDFLRSKFPYEVGEMMKPHTQDEDGELSRRLPADVVYEGKPIQRMMFRPDWVDYGNDFTHVQLHDLQKALADGMVDISEKTVKLESIYRTVVKKATNDLITDVKFTVPDSTPRKLYGQRKILSDKLFETGGYFEGKKEAQQNDTVRLVDSPTAVNFESITPEEALAKLNKKFRLQSWVNRNGELVVGIPEANSVRHLAAPYDDRVWRYKDPSISHPREPIKTIVVEGSWVDEPGADVQPLEWFDKGGTGDVRAHGFAARDDIEYGTTKKIKANEAKRDSLPKLAKMALQDELRRQNTGSVTIDPDNSGESVSKLIDLRVGDILHLVPNDAYYDHHTATTGQIGDPIDNPESVCGPVVNNEAYYVSGVQHQVTQDGNWEVHADLTMYPDDDISEAVLYFDPGSGEWLSEEDVFDSALIEDI